MNLTCPQFVLYMGGAVMLCLLSTVSNSECDMVATAVVSVMMHGRSHGVCWEAAWDWEAVQGWNGEQGGFFGSNTVRIHAKQGHGTVWRVDVGMVV